MSQHLKSIINPEDEAVFVLKGTDLFRRPLKQIGNSIFNIKASFVKRGTINVIPQHLDSSLSTIKDDIVNRINDGSFQDKCFELFRDEIFSDRKESNVTIFVYEYLPMALGIQVSVVPSDSICDVLLVQTHFPVLLLTVISDTDPSSEVRQYTTTLARSTTRTLGRFIDEDFHLISGIIKQVDLRDRDSFVDEIKSLISRACSFVTTHSLFVGTARYDKIITSVFASICEIQSVPLSEDNCKYLHFLTKEQGGILVEKLNSPRVLVTTTPKAGSTTLLLEIVKRLSTMHRTLLICRTKQEAEKFRSFHPDTVCRADLPVDDLSQYLTQYRHIVDDTGTVESNTSGKLWKFTKDVYPDHDVLKEKMSRKEEVDLETYTREDDTMKGGPTSPKMAEEDLDLKKETDPILTESDKDVHIEALEAQIQALRAKILHQTKGTLKQEPTSEWSSQDPLQKPKHIKGEYLDKKPVGFQSAVLKISPKAETTTQASTDVQPYSVGFKTTPIKPDPAAGFPLALKTEEAMESPDVPIEVFIKREPIDVSDVKDEPNTQSTSTDGDVEINSDTEDSSSISRDPGYPCPLCSVRCTSEADYTQHFMAKHLPSEQTVTASSTDARSSDIDLPGPSHRPDPPLVSTPPASETPGLKRVNITYLKCPDCPKRFKSERGYRKHKINKHPLTSQPTSEGETSSPGPDFLVTYHTEGVEGTHNTRVQCPAMTLDTNRVNREFHVSEDGLELKNTERRGQSQGDIGGVRKYMGTCSRLPIPLPPSPSTLTTPGYWETHTRVRVERVEEWWTLLEMGLCQEGAVDTDWWVSDQTRNSWAVWVGGCLTHGPGLCTRVYREGKQVGECCTNTMSNTRGTTAVLHYGVVLDVGRGRLAFLDLDRGIVLSSFNVQFTESLRPMFGVCDWPSDYTVTMRLVSGAEITMTDTKKDLICQALSTT